MCSIQQTGSSSLPLQTPTTVLSPINSDLVRLFSSEIRDIVCKNSPSDRSRQSLKLLGGSMMLI